MLIEKTLVFSDAFIMKALFIIAILSISFSIFSKEKKTSSVPQFVHEAPKMVDLDEIEKVEKESAPGDVTPKLVKIKKEESQVLKPKERFPASLDTVEDKKTEKRGNRLKSLIRESLFEKEVAKRDLDSLIEDDELTLDDEDTKEDFGDIEVHWKTSN